MTSAFIPNHMIRVSVVAVGTTLHTNPGIQSIGIPQPVGIHPTGVRGLGSVAGSGTNSPHGRAGAGTTRYLDLLHAKFTPRACGGWVARTSRRTGRGIHPTGVRGLGSRMRCRPTSEHSSHVRVGLGMGWLVYNIELEYACLTKTKSVRAVA